jgi:hypothetical protein
MPQRGISPLVLPGGIVRAAALSRSSLPQSLAERAHQSQSQGQDTGPGPRQGAERSHLPLRSPSVPTTHPVPRGGAAVPDRELQGQGGSGGRGGSSEEGVSDGGGGGDGDVIGSSGGGRGGYGSRGAGGRGRAGTAGGGASFTDLRFSAAQRAKGTFSDGYVTIGRGLMQSLYDAASP